MPRLIETYSLEGREVKASEVDKYTHWIQHSKTNKYYQLDFIRHLDPHHLRVFGMDIEVGINKPDFELTFFGKTLFAGWY